MRIEGIIATTGAVSQHLTGTEGVTRQDRDRVQQEKLQQQITAHPQERTGETRAAGEKFLASAVQQAQEIVHAFDQAVTFDIHRDTQATIIRVVNHATGEVVREIPAEKFLDMLAAFQKQLSGLFVDQTQ